ncbi:hypothetical protein LCGC14_2241520 [marine sediment metagenome]|uniref:Uncharacterized protein n=1 Tax=marine sediment metagenome TaxID=412755 RepID=A0A0F9G0C8_9ZZZZ
MKTIEVSDETYEKIKDQIEADNKKKEFEPIEIHGGCFIVTANNNDLGCEQVVETVGRFIKALQSAIDDVGSNK